MPERNDRVVTRALSDQSHNGQVLGVILAGGGSRRYGQDKALARLGGVPLLQWVADRIRPQVSELIISGEARPGFALQTVADKLPNGGPLAALCSILTWAEREDFPLVMTVSCDTPFVPCDMADVLRGAVADYDCAIAGRDGAMHPTCALWKTDCRAKIETAFDTGVRSLHGAISYVNAVTANVAAGAGPGGDPFFNINSQLDMAVAQDWLAQERQSP